MAEHLHGKEKVVGSNPIPSLLVFRRPKLVVYPAVNAAGISPRFDRESQKGD